MSEEIERKIQDRRRDEKLFKQAYKAAKEAREVEKKNKKKKILNKVLLYLTIPVFVGVSVYLLLGLVKPKSEYIEAGKLSQNILYKDITERDIERQVEITDLSREISATSAIAYNPNTGQILFEKNINEEKYIASLTKILAAIVVLENYSLDDVVEVSRENIPENLDWQLEIKEGEKITVENLLKAMLISSYNDAAFVVANAYKEGGYDGFILAMNEKANILRMVNSHFTNPAGIDQEGNYSTALDVAILISSAQRYKKILEIVEMGSDTVNWSSGEEVLSKKIFTTNQLYGVNPYSKGFKTGITKLAKQCFVGYFDYLNGEKLITVVLESEDRFTDTAVIERYLRGYLK